MAKLSSMPELQIHQAGLAEFGHKWHEEVTSPGGRVVKQARSLSRTPPQSSSQLGEMFDRAVGTALAAMLGNLPVVTPNGNSLIPRQADCVEVGPVRVIGGVRPQNFDVGYRPDGVRFVFDSKSLNDAESVRKNYQNMINDLATEATTVHSRFPYALVSFGVVFPKPCLVEPQLSALVQTLERLAQREEISDPSYMAEAIFLMIWNPDDGSISTDTPEAGSVLRLERFSARVAAVYARRYKGLPPHAI